MLLKEISCFYLSAYHFKIPHRKKRRTFITADLVNNNLVFPKKKERKLSSIRTERNFGQKTSQFQTGRMH
jgi:hypothetical protein